MLDTVAVALGTFDGLHLGHRYLISKMLDTARAENICSLVYTFSSVPKALHSAAAHVQIQGPNDKFEMLKSLGVDIVLIKQFDDDLKRTGARDFIANLCRDYDVKHIFVGADFRFGEGAKGNVDLLKELAEDFGFVLNVVEFLCDDVARISSSRIRQELAIGDLEGAARLLGRRHFISGVAREAKDDAMWQEKASDSNQIIRVYLGAEMSLIKSGEYRTILSFDGVQYDCLSRIEPVYSKRDEGYFISTLLFRNARDIIGKRVKIEFVSRLGN